MTITNHRFWNRDKFKAEYRKLNSNSRISDLEFQKVFRSFRMIHFDRLTELKRQIVISEPEEEPTQDLPSLSRKPKRTIGDALKFLEPALKCSDRPHIARTYARTFPKPDSPALSAWRSALPWLSFDSNVMTCTLCISLLSKHRMALTNTLIVGTSSFHYETVKTHARKHHLWESLTSHKTNQIQLSIHHHHYSN